jgi:hypothetical protein
VTYGGYQVEPLGERAEAIGREEGEARRQVAQSGGWSIGEPAMDGREAVEQPAQLGGCDPPIPGQDGGAEVTHHGDQAATRPARGDQGVAGAWGQAVEHTVGPQAPFAPARVTAEEQREVTVGIDGLDDDPATVEDAALQMGAGAAVVAVEGGPIRDPPQQLRDVVHGRTIGASASCPAIAAASQCPVQ